MRHYARQRWPHDPDAHDAQRAPLARAHSRFANRHRVRLRRHPSDASSLLLAPAASQNSGRGFSITANPPACGPAGVVQRLAMRSELGRQVTVDFESDADFHKCGSCPGHLLLPAFEGHRNVSRAIPNRKIDRRSSTGRILTALDPPTLLLALSRAAYLYAAAQTRAVSVARIRLDSRKSVRPFKGIICDDVCEFESHMPSQAVPSVWAMCDLQKYARHSRELARQSRRRPHSAIGNKAPIELVVRSAARGPR
jgi:hypothetical protein